MMLATALLVSGHLFVLKTIVNNDTKHLAQTRAALADDPAPVGDDDDDDEDGQTALA